MITVACFDAKPYDEISLGAASEGSDITFRYFTNRLCSDTVRLAEGADAICVFVNDTLDRAVIDALVKQGVGLAALRCAGYNNVDFEAAHGRLHITRVPAYSPHAVAEHTVALLLTLNRKTHKAYFRTRDGNFNINGLMGFDLFGKTAGIIGTGKIGMVLAQILRGFGMRVVAYDKFPQKGAQELVEYMELKDVLAAADVLSLHCPLTPETHHLLNAETLSTMKPGVFVINTGRGALIDTLALIEGLKSGHIGAAALDVYEEESEYFFEDLSGQILQDDVLARLLTFPNVLLTSHQAFFTREALGNIADTTIESITQFAAGQSLEYEICYKCAAGSAGECCREHTGKCF